MPRCEQQRLTSARRLGCEPEEKGDLRDRNTSGKDRHGSKAARVR
jgi:hypothetical protein